MKMSFIAPRKLLRLLLARTGLLLCAALWLAGSPNATAQAPPKLTCVVCGKSPLMGKVWVHQAGHLCAECARIEARCSRCGLPVKDGFLRTGDGRFICKREAADAVLSADEARRIFADTAEELRRAARGTLELKFGEVNVALFDVDYWNHREGRPVPESSRRIGFSHSRAAGGALQHTVALWSGQSRVEYAAVCAHEYTHLWINENKPAAREIEPATIEAICELSAYKLMAGRGDTNQLASIRRNPYTQGRILDLIETEARLGWDAVLDWVRRGATPKLDAQAPPPRPPAPADTSSPLFSQGTTAARTLPGELVLQGILGTGRNALALVGGESFRAGEELPVKLAGRTVRVRCVEIQPRAVIVSLDGSTNLTTLRLDGR